MGRRNNFLSTDELAKVQENSKTYELDFATSIELFTQDCNLRNLRPHTS